MEPAQYASQLMQEKQEGAADYIAEEILKALKQGDDAQALYLDSVLQLVEEAVVSGRKSA